MKQTRTKKKDGFNAQKAIVLPRAAISQCEQSLISSTLHITDIGYYPRAEFHYRQRELGSSQHILIYCVTGEGWALIEKKKITIKQGEYLILPQNIKHIYGASQEKPWSIFWIHFKGTLSEKFINILTGGYTGFSGTIPYNEERIELFNNIYNTLQSGYSTDNLRYVSMVLFHYLGTFCYPHIFKPPKPAEAGKIDIAIKFMQDNLHEVLRLKEIARHIHQSPSHFSALFKKETGFPPLEYFNQIKMQRACQLLEFSNLQVKELACALGYQDPFYFSRLFTKMMGISPLEYRKRKKVGN